MLPASSAWMKCLVESTRTAVDFCLNHIHTNNNFGWFNPLNEPWYLRAQNSKVKALPFSPWVIHSGVQWERLNKLVVAVYQALFTVSISTSCLSLSREQFGAGWDKFFLLHPYVCFTLADPAMPISPTCGHRLPPMLLWLPITPYVVATDYPLYSV